MDDGNLFLVFGFVQMISFGFIIYFVLGSLGTLGLDTQIVLSCVFPVFTFVVEYMIYSKM